MTNKSVGAYCIRPIFTAILLICTTAFAQQKGTYTDPRDKKTYKTAKIGEQVWLAENLNYAAQNAKCYEDEPENCTKYGRMYDWQTAMTACPSGWHLPSQEELRTFADTSALLGGEGIPYLNEQKQTAISYQPRKRGYWWSSKENSAKNKEAYTLILPADKKTFLGVYYDKDRLLSVRCVKDLDPPSKQISLTAQENPQ